MIQKTMELFNIFKNKLKIKNIEVSAFITGDIIENLIHIIKSSFNDDMQKVYIRELADLIYKYLFL